MSKKRGTFWKCLVSAVCCLVTCVDRKKKTLRRMCNVVVLESFFFFFVNFRISSVPTYSRWIPL